MGSIKIKHEEEKEKRSSTITIVGGKICHKRGGGNTPPDELVAGAVNSPKNQN